MHFLQHLLQYRTDAELSCNMNAKHQALTSLQRFFLFLKKKVRQIISFKSCERKNKTGRIYLLSTKKLKINIQIHKYSNMEVKAVSADINCVLPHKTEQKL